MSENHAGALDVTDWGDPWPAVVELAGAVGPEDWVLIGGLMVQLHCRLHGQPPSRATRDIDTLTRVEVTWRHHLDRLECGLRSLGYEPVVPLARDVPLHRMRRDAPSRHAQVDFLIADHLPPVAVRDLPRPTPVQAPAGRNALHRAKLVELRSGTDVVAVAVPDLLGALQLKIEAYRADSRGRERHLRDAVTLAGLIVDAVPDPPLHGSAAHRLRVFVRWMDDDELLAWVGIEREVAVDAALAVEEVLRASGETTA